MSFEPIDAVRVRVIMDALKDVARTGNIAAFPISLALRRAQQTFFNPGEVFLARALSSRRDEHIPILGGLLPFVKELTPREFSALITDIKAQGPSFNILVESHKSGTVDTDALAQRFKPLRNISVGYSALSGTGRGLRTPGSLTRRVVGSPFRAIRQGMRKIRYDLSSPKNQRLMERGLKGGPGSGNWGHNGRAGGGSTPTIPHGGGAASYRRSFVPGDRQGDP